MRRAAETKISNLDVEEIHYQFSSRVSPTGMRRVGRAKVTLPIAWQGLALRHILIQGSRKTHCRSVNHLFLRYDAEVSSCMI